ncbi:MAG: glycosyltransferase family 4 protein [Bacteroidota bacterium]
MSAVEAISNEKSLRKRVLVIAYYFPPMGLAGVQRTLKFVKYLPERGWEPIVLTITPTGYFAQDFSLLQEVESLGVRIVRTGSIDPTRVFTRGKQSPVVVKMPREPIRKVLNRLSQVFFIPDNKIGWKHAALRSARKIIAAEKIDLIFATAPPYTDFLIGAKLKQATGLPLVLDYRDAWLDNPYHFYVTPFHRWIHSHLERHVLRSADKIVAINRRIKELLLRRYRFLRYEDVVIIPQGYDPADFHFVETPVPHGSKMRFTYAGTFYEDRSPRYFLLALKNVLDRCPEIRPKIEACFIGNFRAENLKLVRTLGLTDVVTVLGYKSHKETVQCLVASDVLWLIIGEGRGKDMMSTGKLFEYIGARKPILGCVPNGVARSTILESGAGFVTDPYDVKGIENAILQLYGLWEKGDLPAPRTEFTERYRRDLLTAELARIFEFLT